MIRHRIGSVEAQVNRLAALLRGRKPPPPRRLQTAQDVIDLVHEQVEAVRADAGRRDTGEGAGHRPAGRRRPQGPRDRRAGRPPGDAGDGPEAAYRGNEAMNTNGLARRYEALTPWERLPLLVAASARGDEVERDRLARSAPQHDFRVPDYWGLCEGLEELATMYLLHQLELAALYGRVVGLLERRPLFRGWKRSRPSTATAPEGAADAGAPLRDVGRRLDAALRRTARRSGGRAARHARPRHGSADWWRRRVSSPSAPRRPPPTCATVAVAPAEGPDTPAVGAALSPRHGRGRSPGDAGVPGGATRRVAMSGAMARETRWAWVRPPRPAARRSPDAGRRDAPPLVAR